MAVPSKKSKAIEDYLNLLYVQITGHSKGRRETIIINECVACGNEASKFHDDLSRKEYTISGRCQVCQDEMFGYSQSDLY
jgi:hypothetical protein